MIAQVGTHHRALCAVHVVVIAAASVYQQQRAYSCTPSALVYVIRCLIRVLYPHMVCARMVDIDVNESRRIWNGLRSSIAPITPHKHTTCTHAKLSWPGSEKHSEHRPVLHGIYCASDSAPAGVGSQRTHVGHARPPTRVPT